MLLILSAGVLPAVLPGLRRPGDPEPRAPRGAACGGGWPVFASDAIGALVHTDLALGAGGAQGDPDLPGLLFRFSERAPDPSSPSGYSTGWVEHGPFASLVEAAVVASRGTPHEIYVAGQDLSGEDVVERWSFPGDPGGYRVTRSLHAGVPLGTPAPLSTATISIVGGGAYVAPRARTRLDPVREEVYRGDAIGGTRCLVVDPEGRFLLVLSEGSALLRVRSLGPDAVVEPLLTVQEVPQLGHVSEVRVLQHPSEGRKVLLRSAPWADEAHHVLLGDAENDGVFESLRAFAGRSFASSPYASVRWADDFFHYRFGR